jgi:hypothetical protein
VSMAELIAAGSPQALELLKLNSIICEAKLTPQCGYVRCSLCARLYSRSSGTAHRLYRPLYALHDNLKV